MTQLFNIWRSEDAGPKKAQRAERKPKSETPKPRPQGKRRAPQPPIGGDENNFGRIMRTLVLWLGLGVVAVILFMVTKAGSTAEPEISYTQFEQFVAADKVGDMTIDIYPLSAYELHGTFKADEQITNEQSGKAVSTKRFLVELPAIDAEMRATWKAKGITYRFIKVQGNWFDNILGFLPWIGIIVVWLLIARRMQSGGNGMMGPKGIFSFGKSRAKLLNETAAKVTFADVAGADEAKQELAEIIEFLKEPLKFQRLGGKIPRGVLLLGPPGTGKTLLARAVAGEAGVPFLSISGAEFVEMFVGVGASRVRDLFEQGKKNAPCIVFIDEIDAVGRHRGAGLGGGHDEREQTLNQLLVEMDGFEQNSGVIIIAATNRPDVLDPALLRPGRFDRQVVVDRPDVRGREGIFKVHTRTIPLAPDVDLATLAKGTPGLAGADLANLVNEAALLAARHDSTKVSMIDFENAKDKVMMGVERKSLLISEEEKKTTSYHECGHVLVARKIPEADPVHKVTIIPRGRALGLTTYLPIDEKHTYSKEYLEAMIAYALGGRAAEKIIFNQLTTGAGNDIERATQLARKMVCEWGMSERLGPLSFGAKQEEIFLGREIAQHRDYSESTAVAIDEEVRVIIERGQKRAEQILRENVDMLHRLAQALLEREILDGEEIDRIMRGETLPALEKKIHVPPPVNGTQPGIVIAPEKAGDETI